MKSEDTISVRVVHRFAASAERVFDAWLDPQKACKFLFATATGQIVRCDIEPRVGGRFTVIDRRGGEDVEHVGTFVEIDRPRRLVFDMSVPKYSADPSRVSIFIAPLSDGCELSLVHEMPSHYRDFQGRTLEGWRRMLEVLGEQLPPSEPSCGAGLAEHAAIPAKVAPMFAALADTLEKHRAMLLLDDPKARQEDDAYRQLSHGFHEVASRIEQLSAQMAGYRALPACAHDESAFGAPQLEAFQRFVEAQRELLDILRPAVESDEAMLASMQPSR